MLPPPGRSDDQAFGALSAELYGPKRRIGFLICRTRFFRQGGAYVIACGKNQARRFIRMTNDKGFARLHAMHEVSFERVMKKINRENCGTSC
jgi:hypothetical protein